LLAPKLQLLLIMGVDALTQEVAFPVNKNTVDGYEFLTSTVKVKVKLSRYTPWRHMGERRYSSYSFSTSALDGGEWSASRPGRALPPGKEHPVPIG
jgi:hypothetical protein